MYVWQYDLHDNCQYNGKFWYSFKQKKGGISDFKMFSQHHHPTHKPEKKSLFLSELCSYIVNTLWHVFSDLLCLSFIDSSNGIKQTWLLQPSPQRNNTCWILLECKHVSCYFSTQKIEFIYSVQNAETLTRKEISCIFSYITHVFSPDVDPSTYCVHVYM